MMHRVWIAALLLLAAACQDEQGFVNQPIVELREMRDGVVLGPPQQVDGSGLCVAHLRLNEVGLVNAFTSCDVKPGQTIVARLTKFDPNPNDDYKYVWIVKRDAR